MLLKGRPVAQESAEAEQMVPRNGSIYDRLDKARAQRMKSLSPQLAANDTPALTSRDTSRPARSKSSLLPVLKSQEAFDTPIKNKFPQGIKLGIGLLIFAVLAGGALLNWGSDELQTTVTAPAEIAPAAIETALPNADDPARVAEAARVEKAAVETLPAIPDAPSEPVVIEVQQDAAPLKSPGPAPNLAQDP